MRPALHKFLNHRWGRLGWVIGAILLIGYLDSLSQALSQSLLYGLLCMWAGYRLSPRAAAATVVGCIVAHGLAGLVDSHPSDYYLQSASEAALLAIVASGARSQRLQREDLLASRELAAREHAVLLQHLERAREVQCELLGTPPAQAYPYELGLEFRVAVELGGDVFFVSPVQDGLFFFVGDVSGKGPKAALAATSIRVLLDTIVRQTHAPGQVLAELQSRFLHLFPGGLFVTAFCAFADPYQECLIYANAGHDPALLRPAAHHPLQELCGQSLPLGVDPAETFPESRVAFGPQDRLLVYTDGLIDAPQSGGQRLGIEPVAHLLATCDGDGKQLANELLSMAPEPRHDDVMILVLTCAGRPQVETVNSSSGLPSISSASRATIDRTPGLAANGFGDARTVDAGGGAQGRGSQRARPSTRARVRGCQSPGGQAPRLQAELLSSDRDDCLY